MSSQTPEFPVSRDPHNFQPSPLYQELRDQESITKCKLFDGSEAWLLTKHDHITAALSSTHLSADRRSTGFPEIHAGGSHAKEQRPTFVNLDNPAHDEQRVMLEQWFTKAAVDGMKPMISGVVESTLDSFEKELRNAKGSTDLIKHFAARVPPQIVLKMLGVPERDFAMLGSDGDVQSGTSRTAAEQSDGDAKEYMKNFVDGMIADHESGKDSGGHSIVSTLIKERYVKNQLTREDVVNLSMLVLTAGNAALVNSIGLGVITLLTHPEQLQRLKKDLKLAPKVVMELVRYNTASALNSRRCATEDIEVDGHKISKGEGVICAVQSGDRDEAKLRAADTFDIDHKYGRENTLGFGYGVHRCQAEWLSTAELEAVFSRLFARLPNLVLAVDRVEDLKFTTPTQNLGVLELPVRLA